MSLSYANSVKKISIKVLIHHVMSLLINYLENDEEHLLLEHVNLASSVTHTHTDPFSQESIQNQLYQFFVHYSIH